MFRINFDHVKLHHAGCPSSGLAAVDWRRARGLPDAPTSHAGTFNPAYLIESESLCRLAPHRLDGSADLVVNGAVSVPVAVATALLAAGDSCTDADDKPTPDMLPHLADLIAAWDQQHPKA